MSNSDQDRGKASRGSATTGVRARMERWLGRTEGTERAPASNSPRDGGARLQRTMEAAPSKAPKAGDTTSRAGEPVRTRFRSDRIVSENGAWYIATREGINVGPYDDPETARREARRLAKLLAEQSELGAEAQALTIRRFMTRPTFGKP
ncbi:MAG: hypothetical protein KF911_09275 [Pseudomonadales bacterium]|nr:hypothetical protein [Pseudomonadales bacterium]